MSDIEKIKKDYAIIVKSIENIESEIDCIIRQKQMISSNFTELIKAQSKLISGEKLLRAILNNIEKYEIINFDIKKSIEVASQNNFQKKQHEIDKKYSKGI